MVGRVFCLADYDGCKHQRASFQPSNHTVGQSFIAEWCGNCARDKALREGGALDECDDNQRCDIVGRTMAYNVDDTEYPDEWIYDRNGQPCCTAFIPSGDPVPAPRCDHTDDIFGGEA
jgi:hypothetical protein